MIKSQLSPSLESKIAFIDSRLIDLLEDIAGKDHIIELECGTRISMGHKGNFRKFLKSKL